MNTVRKPNRKDEILKLAFELLQTKGYHAFSYQDLSSQLGITKASIHHHFPRKIDLGMALCDAIGRWRTNEYNRLLASQGKVLDKLDRYINESVRRACGENMICPLNSLHADAGSLPIEMINAMKELDYQELEFMGQLLQEGRDSGELNFKGPIDQQAVVCVMTYKSALLYSRSHGREIFDKAQSQLNRLLINAD